MWLTKRGHARLNRGEETFPCRTKTKELSDSSFCFNVFLMLHPPPPHIPSVSAADTGPCWGSRELGCQRGVLGVCRLTWAQAAICHPTLASLILILSPALPSRPAVSSPQKGILLGCVVVVGSRGDKGREELWELGSATARPFDLVPGPAGQTAQTDSIVSTPCRLLLLLLSLLSATQTPGADGETEEGEEKETDSRGGWWANEHNEETDTNYPDPPSSIQLWVRISLFPTGRLLPSPPLPCVTPPLSLSSHSQASPRTVWPSTPLLAIYTLPFFSNTCQMLLVI